MDLKIMKNNCAKKECDKLGRAVLDEFVKCVEEISYGEVVITIHDSKVVQIEKREKRRFQD